MDLKRLISILSTVGLSFLLTTQAISSVPWQKYSYFSNSGGLNDNVSTLQVADGEATDIQNIVFDTGGTLNKRYGFTNITAPGGAFKVDTNATGVTGLYFYKKSNGNKFLVAIANVSGTAKIYEKQYDASGNVPSGAWTSIDAGIFPASYTNDNLPSFSVAQDQLVITIPASSQNHPFTWTGSGNVSTLTADVNVPNATINVFHKNILFLAGDSANPSRVTFSDLTNGITKYVATDFFDLDKNNGQKITGMISAFGNLYIFEDNSIWLLSGTSRDDFSLQKMVDNVGTLSHQSISIVNNEIVFVTKQNDIAVYDGNFSVKFISSKIRNTIGGNNFNRAQQALGIGFSSYRYKDLDYYAAETIVGSSTNNQVLLFDTFRQAWTKLISMNPDSWCIAESNTGQNVLVWGDYNGYVYYYPNIGTFSDVTNTITTPFPIDANVITLLHLNNNVTDYENTPKTFTNNNVTFSSASFPFSGGGFSGVFNGTNANITALDSEDWDFSNFAIDFWVKFTSLTGTQDLFSQYVDNNNFIDIYKFTDNKIYIQGKNTGVNFVNINTTAASFSDTNFHHVEISVSGSTTYIFIDGVSQTLNTVVAFSAPTEIASGISIGAFNSGAWLNATLSEYRISNVTRDIVNFTPPTSPYGQSMTVTTSPAIYSFYQTKWFRYSDISLGDKYLRLIKTYVLNNNSTSILQTEIKTDYATNGSIYNFTFQPSGALWGVGIWGQDKWGGGGLNIDREEPNLGTQMFQLKYSNNTAGQSMTILGWDLFIEPTDRI